MHGLPVTGQCFVFMNTGQIEAITVTGRAHCQRQVAFFKAILNPQQNRKVHIKTKRADRTY